MDWAKGVLAALALAVATMGWIVLSDSDAAAADFNCNAVTQIPAEECEALVALYDSTDGDNWTNNDGWLSTPSPCDWYGVHCAAGTVTQLLLTGNGIDGEIPSTIGNLSGLWILGLADNNIEGRIPGRIADLENLEWLFLNTNRFSGNLPHGVGDLPNLHTLMLHDNDLYGALPLSMTTLDLDVLHFNETELCEPDDPAFQSWLDGISILERTGVLCTGDADPTTFSCEAVTQIPFKECTALVALYQSTNGENWNENSGWLQDNSPCGWHGVECDNSSPASVYSLSLSFNQLNGQIPAQIGDLNGLLFLSLNSNQLSGPIPSELGSLENLIDLHLPENQLSGPIPEALGNLENLEFLSLFNNELNGPIPDSFSELEHLEELELAENQLSGSIPKWFGELSSLSLLALQHNEFTGPLPHTFSSLENLAVLAFNDTNLCEPSDPAFQNWLSSIEFVESTGVLCGEDGDEPVLPDRPQNQWPHGNSDDVSVIVTLSASEFSHPSAAAEHTATEWRVTSHPGNYDSPVFALQEHTDLTAIGLPRGLLEHSATYY
jgi:Leucine-rich repeat (LRR) protein